MGTNIRQTSSGGIAFIDDATSAKVFETGGVTHRAPFVRKAAITGVAATTGGAIFSWRDPENSAILIDRIEIDVTTKSTGAANLSVGVAADAVTSSANLIDTYAIGGAEKVVNNIDDKGTNGKSVQKLSGTQYLTMTGSASTVGLVANLYIHYYPT